MKSAKRLACILATLDERGFNPAFSHVLVEAAELV
jgi:hypothetical protein